MTPMNTDEEDPQMPAIKGRCMFACLQQAVTAHYAPLPAGL